MTFPGLVIKTPNKASFQAWRFSLLDHPCKLKRIFFGEFTIHIFKANIPKALQ